MKTLEQLGISPAPWKINENATVLDRYSEIISGQYGPYNWHNASLIAAAPDMYEALYESVKEKCTECHEINDYESDIGIEWQMCEGCPVKKWRAALAKAAGESEVK